MVFCWIIAILSTLYWIDTLVISVTNARMNPYRNSAEVQKQDRNSAIARLCSIAVASICWAIIFYHLV